MKILQVAVAPNNPLSGCAIFKKGFEKNNHQVSCFEYRQLAKLLGKVEMNNTLYQRVTHSDCDMILIGKGELIDPNILARIKQDKPNVKIALWHGDQRPKPEKFIVDLLQQVDYFLHTTSGERLQYYHSVGNQEYSIFFINPWDPEYTLPTVDKVNNIIFTGSNYSIAEKSRTEVIDFLKNRKDTYLPGILHPKVKGQDYFKALMSSRLGISVSGMNNFKYYTSARLTHYLASGLPTLVRRFPEAEKLFEDKKHVIYFDNLKELSSLINYYLKNSDEARVIGEEGQELINQQYNTENMVAHILNVINSKESNFDWTEFYKR